MFPTTSWTIVAAAGRHSTGSPDALAKLCAAYWFPVYAFIRRKGYRREQAEDLCQEFFAWILERGALAAARRERGRFRSFLLATAGNFLANEWDREHAQKRGGGASPLPLDFESGDVRYCREPFHEFTPEALFDRQWAMTILELALARLQEEQKRRGHTEQFERLRAFLTEDNVRGSYEEIAADLKIGVPALRTALHRLRRRYSELIREEIAAIVADPNEVEDEIRFLLAAVENP